VEVFTVEVFTVEVFTVAVFTVAASTAAASMAVAVLFTVAVAEALEVFTMAAASALSVVAASITFATDLAASEDRAILGDFAVIGAMAMATDSISGSASGRTGVTHMHTAMLHGRDLTPTILTVLITTTTAMTILTMIGTILTKIELLVVVAIKATDATIGMKILARQTTQFQPRSLFAERSQWLCWKEQCVSQERRFGFIDSGCRKKTKTPGCLTRGFV